MCVGGKGDSNSYHILEQSCLICGFSPFGFRGAVLRDWIARSVERCEILRKENQLWEILWPISASVISLACCGACPPLCENCPHPVRVYRTCWKQRWCQRLHLPVNLENVACFCRWNVWVKTFSWLMERLKSFLLKYYMKFYFHLHCMSVNCFLQPTPQKACTQTFTFFQYMSKQWYFTYVLMCLPLTSEQVSVPMFKSHMWCFFSFVSFGKFPIGYWFFPLCVYKAFKTYVIQI